MFLINFNTPKSYKFNFNIEKLCHKICTEVIKYEKLKFDFSANISIVSSKKIKNINKLERDINKVTDVLSFPNIPFDKPLHFNPFINKNFIDVSIVDLNNNTIFLGDVIICYDKVKFQAKLYGHSEKREFAFLLVHSLLHLLGYDHMNKKDEKIMFDLQDSILNNLKILR